MITTVLILAVAGLILRRFRKGGFRIRTKKSSLKI